MYWNCKRKHVSISAIPFKLSKNLNLLCTCEDTKIEWAQIFYQVSLHMMIFFLIKIFIFPQKNQKKKPTLSLIQCFYCLWELKQLQIPVLSNNIAFTNPGSAQQHCFFKSLFCTTTLPSQISVLSFVWKWTLTSWDVESWK